MWSFASGFFHSAYYFKRSSMLQHVSAFHSFFTGKYYFIEGVTTVFYTFTSRWINALFWAITNVISMIIYVKNLYMVICFLFSCVVSVQFSPVAQSCPTLCDPMDCSTPGFPVPHQHPELSQTHAHRVGDAIQPSHSLSSPSPPAPNPSQHQGLYQRVNSSHEVDKVLEFQLQHQSFQ